MNATMKALLCSSVIGFGAAAQAQEAKPENELSYNAGIVSDYRYRGISQSRLEPALQGGMDYVNNPTGLYVGTWLSTIHWIDDAGGSDNIEWDIYAGKRGNLTEAVGYDVGVLAYVYPGNSLQPDANTTELYGQLSYGVAYAKYSYALTNLFGINDSKGSGYLDLGATFDLGSGYALAAHAGHQTVDHHGTLSYNDWKLGLTKDAGFASLGIALVGTDSHAYLGPAPGFKNLGRTGLVVSLIKNF